MTDAVALNGSRAKPANADIAIRIWLGCVIALIFAMVVVGGATRLTGSGLSITEWKPILGAIPPLSAADWQEAFDKYRQIPQYQLVNKGMSLEEFKFIFWWEWAHRFLGRFIGVAFALPFLVFAFAGTIRRDLAPSLIVLFALGALQGFMGWYMVQSGLVDRVSVSQYRLAAHLGLAAIIYAAMIWVALGVGQPARTIKRSWAWLSAAGLVVFSFIQIVLGAFVAGMKAGFAYNTWPLMDGEFVPDGLFVMQPWHLNLFENALTVQFNHRMAAYMLFGWAILHAIAMMRTERAGRLSAVFLAGAVTLQAVLGIWTLVAQVPLSLGLVHQAGAFIVLAIAVYHLHRLSRGLKG
ncbi:COX15/CtaA family protein [Dichotomicrobium thermohalophilum]|uniref:Heme A synthase n=1 Tax=Dichotomicrobium thermohalophilum TaxID=933063 RepID=A0A397Q713_9HYPH|nr:COX15/CtaA family protein [Dichotomicrobium thermohalophilum]RIA55585.1 cytochrome c oxidase assembly protein subunit 15 [Dichotomicrobium thermohalophilum]